MKSTIKVSISGMAFNLENDAYARLQRYLESIEKTFAGESEGREIMEDIEVRIAELFSARIQSAEQAVTLSMVNEVLGIIGSAEEITGDEEQTKFQQAPPPNKIDEPVKKRLFRDIDHRVIGGVCSGLGNYFGIDRVLVRLVFIGFFFVLPIISKLNSGFGETRLFGKLAWLTLLLYIILWIVIPAARTMKEKMAMRKEPLTPVPDNSRSEYDENRAHRNDFGSVLGRIIGGFFRVVGWFIVGVMALVALIFIVTLPVALVTGHAVFGSFGFLNLTEVLQTYTSVPVWLVVLLTTLLICIPLVGAIYGICKLLFHFKSKLRIGLILFLVWLVSLISLVGIATYVAAQSKNSPDRLLSGDTTFDYTEERPLKPFKVLKMEGNFEVLAIKSDTNYVRIETSSRLLPQLKMETFDDHLKIRFENWRRKTGLSRLTIYFTELEKLYLMGGINFRCNDTLKPAKFYAEIVGAGKINLLLNTPQAEFDMPGAGKLTVAGKTAQATFDVAGAPSINAFDFVVDTMDIDMAGAGEMKINVRKHLRGDATGAGVIRYKGSPSIYLEKTGIVKIKKED